jgi:type II secretory pathway component GspD/PulD (secretin)
VVEVELSDEKAPGIDWTAAAGASRSPSRPALTGLRITDVPRLLAQLATQGTVTTIATPSLLAVNNEPAIVRTDAVTVSVTPQIGSDGAIMLNVTPIVQAPVPRESDMLARVADGETIVLAGFTRDREVRERKNLGLSGGWFGRGTVVTHKKAKLVILLTPRILVGTP